MDPKLTNQEQNMREDMLRHEFPFDPKAWEAMQQLLDGQRDPSPLAAPATPTVEPHPGPGSGRIWLLLLLLALLLAGSATLLHQYSDRQKAVSGSAETPGAGFTPEKPGQDNTNAADVSSASAYPEPPADSSLSASQSTAPTAPDGATNRLHRQSFHPEGGQFSALSPRPAASALPPGTSNLKLQTSNSELSPQPATTGMPPGSAAGSLSGGMTARTTGAETGQAVQPLTAGSAPAISDAFLPAENGKNTAAHEPDRAVSAQAYVSPAGSPGGLPILPLSPLDMPLRPDSIIRPVPFAPAEATRWERGWLFGAGLNSVDYRPLRVKAAPHFGYFLRRRIAPRTALQGELALKFVAGYDWRAEFYDVVPGGSNQVILETERLLYVELPLLLQRSWAPGHSWLLGLKPALTLPIAPYGSFSVVNSGAPRRDYSMHEGFRYLDLGLVLGWEYRPGRRWALDIRYNQGLFDLTKDNFYDQRETHLNSDIQVSLRYFFIKKIRKHALPTLFPAPPARH